jgi:hypothetical protein
MFKLGHFVDYSAMIVYKRYFLPSLYVGLSHGLDYATGAVTIVEVLTDVGTAAATINGLTAGAV